MKKSDNNNKLSHLSSLMWMLLLSGFLISCRSEQQLVDNKKTGSYQLSTTTLSNSPISYISNPGAISYQLETPAPPQDGREGGFLVYAPPEIIILGQTYTIHVTIFEDIAEELISEFPPYRIVPPPNINVPDPQYQDGGILLCDGTMSVTVSPNPFDQEALVSQPGSQRIDGSASWVWQVIPKQPGTQSVLISIRGDEPRCTLDIGFSFKVQTPTPIPQPTSIPSPTARPTDVPISTPAVVITPTTTTASSSPTPAPKKLVDAEIVAAIIDVIGNTIGAVGNTIGAVTAIISLIAASIGLIIYLRTLKKGNESDKNQDSKEVADNKDNAEIMENTFEDEA